MALRDVNFDDIYTFERASTATYFDSNGVLQTAAVDEPRFGHDPVTGEPLGVLIEPSRTNLLTYSEAFDNAAWNKDGNVTIDPNTITAPDGTMTASKLVEDAGETDTGYSLTQHVDVVEGVDYTITFYAKAGGREHVFVKRGNSAGFNFYVEEFHLAGEGWVDDRSSGSIKHVGDGWYKCSATATALNTTDLGGFAIYLAVSRETGLESYLYQGDGASGVYIWGVQQEQGSYPTSYIPTAGAPVTRAADIITTRGDI